MTNRPKSGRLTNRNLKFLNLSCKERGYAREERPHGGYKGVSKQYPLSVLAFDKPAEYMKAVKKSVADHYEEEKQRRLNAPAWMSWANKVKNHTGEQALMVQKYLASNKLEQNKGVIPSYAERMRERCNSAPNDPDTMLVKSNSTHQYLTSTARYGESAELVDITLGRPTRASLLRVHHRSQSAPQVRAPLENKTFLHRQQMMAIKKEDKYKTVDVPKDLQPITQNGETIYEFLVGARYNRSYCADATCMSKLGLYVSRDDPFRCFLHRPFQVSQGASKDTSYQPPQSSLANKSLVQSTQHFTSQQNYAKSPPLKAKSAWEKNDSVTAFGRPTPALTPTPLISQGNLEGNLGVVVTASHVTNKMEKDKKSNEHEESYCIMCHGGVPKHKVLSKKQNTRKKQKDEQECADHLSQDDDWKKSYVNILEQNYHLNITGTRVDFRNTKPAALRSNLHYSSSSVLYRQNKKTVRPHINRNNNRSSRPASLHNGSISGRSDSGSIGDRSGSAIHVAIPAMPTTGEAELLPVEVISYPAQATSGNYLKENSAVITAGVVSEDRKEIDCRMEIKDQKDALTPNATHDDGGTLGISTNDNGKADDVATKESAQDASTHNATTDDRGTLGISTNDNGKADDVATKESAQDASTHNATTDDRGTLGISTNDNGKADDVATKESAQDASTHNATTDDRGTLGISTNDNEKADDVGTKENAQDATGGNEERHGAGTNESGGMQGVTTDGSDTHQKAAEQTECEKQTHIYSVKDKEHEEAVMVPDN